MISIEKDTTNKYHPLIYKLPMFLIFPPISFPSSKDKIIVSITIITLLLIIRSLETQIYLLATTMYAVGYNLVVSDMTFARIDLVLVAFLSNKRQRIADKTDSVGAFDLHQLTTYLYPVGYNSVVSDRTLRSLCQVIKCQTLCVQHYIKFINMLQIILSLLYKVGSCPLPLLM